MKLPPRSPNLNPHAERSVRTIKESCLDRMLLFGEGSLRKTIREFVAHYHRERNHQGLGNRLIIPDESHAGNGGAIRRRDRLGGMLNYYYGWYRVPSLWPSRRDLDAFERWFEWSFHPMVIDLCDHPLLQEEI
jgi:hypothetical protein